MKVLVLNGSPKKKSDTFRMIQEAGSISEAVMYNTYNMGIGMVLALDQADADKAVEALRGAGEMAYVLGTVEAGSRCAELV